MDRIPEPDLMDDMHQARAYAAADFSEPHNAFVDHFRSRFPEFSSGEILDLGCGTADVVIRFAAKYPLVQITGIDGASAMLNIARQDVERNRLSDRIELEQYFLPDQRLTGRKFDAVISNSLLHHLEDPMDLWKTLKICAKESAPVFIMDLMRPDTEDGARDFMLKYTANESPILQKDFYNSLLASYNMEEIRLQLEIMHLVFLNIEQISDRHVLIWGTMSGTGS